MRHTNNNHTYFPSTENRGHRGGRNGWSWPSRPTFTPSSQLSPAERTECNHQRRAARKEHQRARLREAEQFLNSTALARAIDEAVKKDDELKRLQVLDEAKDDIKAKILASDELSVVIKAIVTVVRVVLRVSTAAPNFGR